MMGVKSLLDLATIKTVKLLKHNQLSFLELTSLPSDLLVKLIWVLNKPKKYVLVSYDSEFWLERSSYPGQIHFEIESNSKIQAYEELSRNIDVVIGALTNSGMLPAALSVLNVADVDLEGDVSDTMIDQLKAKLKTGTDIQNLFKQFTGCTAIQVFKASGSLWKYVRDVGIS